MLRVFGRYLVAATSTGVYRVQPTGTGDTGYTNTCAIGERDCPDGEQPSTDLTTCAIFNISSVRVRYELDHALHRFVGFSYYFENDNY